LSSHSWQQHYCPLCFHQYHYQQPVLSSVTVSPSPFLFSLLQLSNSTTWIRSWFTTKLESFEASLDRIVTDGYIHTWGILLNDGEIVLMRYCTKIL
jgi:hypothetical protein